MQININIIGEGTVTGGGEYLLGDTITLSAIPMEGIKFGYFIRYLHGEGYVNQKKTYIPILTFEIDEESDISFDAYFYMDMRSFLTSDYEFDIKDSALVKTASNRQFRLSDDSNTVSERQKDLATADLLIIVCNTPSMIQGKTEKAGNWSETQGSRTLSITDKKDMRDRANMLYSKWGEKANIGVTATIKRIFW